MSVHLPPPFFQAVVEVCDVTSTKPSELPEEHESVYQNIGGIANKNKDRLCNILPSKTIHCTVPSSLLFIFSLFLRLICIILSVYLCLSPRSLGTSRPIHRLFFHFPFSPPHIFLFPLLNFNNLFEPYPASSFILSSNSSRPQSFIHCFKHIIQQLVHNTFFL